jgi:type II secretory pathway component PulF
MNLEDLQLKYFNSKLNKAHKKYVFKTDINVRLKLYKKMGSLIRQSLSINEIVKEISAVQKKGNTADYHFLMHVNSEMQDGRSFSESLKGWTTDNELLLIQSGEKAGDLTNSFDMAISLTKRLKEIKSRVIKEAAYPTVLLTLLTAVLYGFAIAIMPALEGIMPVEEWPSSSQTLYNLSFFVKDNVFFIIIGVIALGSLIKHSMARMTGPIRDRLDSYPPYSIYKDIQSSVFLISVATLMTAQVSLKDSILNLKRQSNKYLKLKMDTILGRLEDGLTGGKAMNTEFMGSSGPDVEIYGKAGDFEKAMMALGEEVIEDKLEKITKVMGLLKMMALLSFAGVIGWMFISFFEITGAMG